MALQMGLQLFTVYDTLRDDFEKGLSVYREMGYKNMELASFDPGELAGKPPLPWKSMSAKELSDLQKRLDINIVSISVPMPLDIEELKKTDYNWAETALYHKEVGSMGPIYSMMFFRNMDEVKYFAEYMDKAGEICMREAGIPVFYHNHYQEFQAFDGNVAMDYVLANTNPKNVVMELDTFWAQRGGVDPVAYLKKLGSRCPLIHQKDLAKGTVKVNLLEGVSKPVTMDMFGAAAKPEEFVEVGEGSMDVAGIIRTAREIGTSYIIVEQDHSQRSLVESAQCSYDNLTRLLAEN